jgi:uncharacterized protein (DUF1800 family)
MTLNPYSGPWTFREAAHLLRRTTFGPNYTMMQTSVNAGLSQTVESLLASEPIPPPPIHYRYEDDPGAPLGETWVNSNEPSPNLPGLNNARKRSMAAWMMGIMLNGRLSIRSKMLLFWHEHLPVNALQAGQLGFKYCDTLLKNVLGNAQTLIEEITIDPAMLLFLNGHQNSVQSPNENYARELLELFTIGRGFEIGPGDYTTYTEQDVRAIARILTGWRVNVTDDAVLTGRFWPILHDQDSKQLSHRFDNIVIQDEGEEEYKTVIDIIFQKSDTAKHLCRQLHIWFVSPEITEEIEENIITPLAQVLMDNNYEVRPALETLLSSEYFFTDSHIGCTISHPIDFLLKVSNTFDFDPFDNIIERYAYWDLLNQLTVSQEMVLLQVSSVAGWKAFYQGPLYDKVWMNSISLNVREAVTDRLSAGVQLGDIDFKLDFIGFIAQFGDIFDPNVLIDECVNMLFAHPISSNQHDFLKNELIPGLPDMSWTMEYSEYLADPTNPDRIEGLNNRLTSLFSTMLKMPEFYLT